MGEVMSDDAARYFSKRESLGRRFVMGGFVAFASGLGETRTAAAQGKPPLVVAAGTDIITLDPCRIAGGNDYLFFANVFEGLYSHDENGRLVPAVAESHTVSPDGLRYEFVLRPNARFHNGDRVTTEDVRFSWQRAIAPETRNPRASVLVANIANVEILDERRCRVLLKVCDASFMENLGEYWYIISKRHAETAGEAAFERQPIGTGPFAFVERQIRSFIKLRGFDSHWGQVPRVGEVTIKIVPDDQSRVAQVQTGESDLVINIPPVLAAPLQRMPNLKVIRAPSFQNIYIAINALGANPVLAKPEVRRALNMAIDKNVLLRTLMQGFGTVQDLPCSPGLLGCDASVQPYGFQPDKAREILTKAGFDFSKPLRMVGQGSGRVPQARETLQGVGTFLNRVGIKTEITMLDYGAWIAVYGARQKDPAVDLIFANFTDYNADPSGRLLRQIRTGGAYSWYSNPEVDTLLAKMNDFSIPEERAPFLHRLFAKLHEEAPLIPLWSADSIYAAGRSVSWKPTPNVSWPVLWNVEKAG